MIPIGLDHTILEVRRRRSTSPRLRDMGGPPSKPLSNGFTTRVLLTVTVRAKPLLGPVRLGSARVFDSAHFKDPNAHVLKNLTYEVRRSLTEVLISGAVSEMALPSTGCSALRIGMIRCTS